MRSALLNATIVREKVEKNLSYSIISFKMKLGLESMCENLARAHIHKVYEYSGSVK